MEEKEYITLKSEFENWAEELVEKKFRFSKPTKPQIERTNKDIQKDKGSQALKTLLTSLVHPEDKEEFISSVDEYPGLVQTFSDEIYKKLGYNSLGK